MGEICEGHVPEAQPRSREAGDPSHRNESPPATLRGRSSPLRKDTDGTLQRKAYEAPSAICTCPVVIGQPGGMQNRRSKDEGPVQRIACHPVPLSASRLTPRETVCLGV